MHTYTYDGSFEGLLTVIFNAYEQKMFNALIVPPDKPQAALFGEMVTIYTEPEKAARILAGLKKRISALAITQLYKTFLSEKEGMENILFRYMQYAFSQVVSIENDFSNPSVLYVTDTAKKVYREKHRMEAFVRFKKTKDGLFYALIEPDFNVLPLIKDHFEKRYADQLWLIYDLKRNYGIYYDLQQTSLVQLDMTGFKEEETILDEQENSYGKLWKNYFTSVNIKERKNKKLHQRHMPLRYWKYLTEKQ